MIEEQNKLDSDDVQSPKGGSMLLFAHYQILACLLLTESLK